MHWARFVFLDGILVPSQSVRCAWSSTGMSSAAVQLVPSYESSRILPSTHVHIFHAEVGLASRAKVVQELARPGLTGDRSLFAAEAAATVGDVFFPSVDSDALAEPNGAQLLRALPFSAFHLRFSGEVKRVQEQEGAGSGAAVVLECAGYDHLLDAIQAIQLTRGYGTLADEERRFFGQENPVFVGTGRRAFFDGMAELIGDSEYGLAETVRRLASVYPARLNVWAAHRFAWTRYADQIAAIDGDTTISRLLNTEAFKRYLRETIQSQYLLPLRSALQAVLDFPMHRIVAVPTPAYFPLYTPPAGTQVTGEERTLTEVVSSRRVGTVRVPARTAPIIPDESGELVRQVDPDTGEVSWRWDTDSGSRTLEMTRLRSSTVPAELSNGNRTLRFRLEEGANGGAATYEINLVDVSTLADALSPLPGSSEDSFLDGFPEEFAPGRTYVLSVDDLSPAAGLTFPRPQFEATVTVEERVRRVAVGVEETLDVTPPPAETSELLNGRRARLGSYAVLPHLWWACPPVCNVVVPDEIKSFVSNDAGMDRPTRLFGKISPGRSGSSQVLVDKFSAPNQRELNAGASDPTDEPRDPSQLYRPEYISGPRAAVYYFEKLHRLVREEEWEPYLRQFLSVEFWNRRLGPQSGILTMKNSIRPVVGAPMLVIRGVSPTTSRFQTPEQRHWLARLATLERVRRNLQRVRGGLSGNAGIARRVREQLQGLYAIREFLDNVSFAESSLDISVQTIESRERTVGAVQSLIVNLSSELAAEGIDLSASRAHRLLGGSAAGYNGRPATRDRSVIARLITTEVEAAQAALTTDMPSPYPPSSLLATWYAEVELNVYDPSACRDALQRDIEIVERAIEAARGELRNLGVAAPKEASYIGYVESVQEAAGVDGESLSVQLTHLRRLGEDLDWDGLGGDDPEALIAFGEDGFADPRYAADRIGQEVYLPVFGCASVADTAEAQRAAEETLEEDEPLTDGLPPVDASDIITLFEHPQVCGEDYSVPETDADGGRTPTINTTDACKALVDAYRELIDSGATSETIFEWLERLRARSTASLADMYRGMPVVLGPDESSPEITDVSRDDASAYPDGRTLEGFFARSFLAGDVDYDRVRVVSVNGDGSESEVALTEEEKDLLRERVDRVRAYLDSIRDKTFTRTG